MKKNRSFLSMYYVMVETNSAKKIQLTTFYQKPHKPKILNQVDFHKASDFSISYGQMLKQYSQIWAIDTNPRTIFGKVANVSAITVCSTDDDEVYFPVLAIIFGDIDGNPEVFGWRKFIEFVQSTTQFSSEHHYGLVVDSDFGEINSYNERKKPVCGTFYLPENFDLIYATSDRRNESIFNKLLSESDKTSKKVLDLISTKESNSKCWNPVSDVERHPTCYLPLATH